MKRELAVNMLTSTPGGFVIRLKEMDFFCAHVS